METFDHHLDAVNPGVARLPMSARTGEGLEAWRDWLTTFATRREVPA
jgi:hydrogenase nickel incorporation protein HypB